MRPDWNLCICLNRYIPKIYPYWLQIKVKTIQYFFAFSSRWADFTVLLILTS